MYLKYSKSWPKSTVDTWLMSAVHNTPNLYGEPLQYTEQCLHDRSGFRRNVWILYASLFLPGLDRGQYGNIRTDKPWESKWLDHWQEWSGTTLRRWTPHSGPVRWLWKSNILHLKIGKTEPNHINSLLVYATSWNESLWLHFSLDLQVMRGQ